MGKVAVHGHRGARACRPENTLAAFEYAIHAGADAIELDIVMTADGVPVVAHDPVAGLTLAQLRHQAPDVPVLSEVLALSSLGNFLFNIELKPFSDAERLAALVVPPAATLPGRVMFQSFDFAILQALRRIAPGIPLGALFEETTEDFVAIAARAGAAIVAPEFHLVSGERVRAAHQAGLSVITWTPNHPAEWKALVDSEIDAIITDDPAGLLRFLVRA